jgi:hypothetical protein
MKLLPKLTPAEKKELKKGVIEVYGKHMNRTALGVVDAVLQLFPSVTFEELKEILPDAINPAAPKNYKSLFKPYTDRHYGVIQSGVIRKECEDAGLDINASHFTEKGETFRTNDGIEVLVSKSWESKDTATNEHDLQNLIDHVAQYGIRVVSFEAKDEDFTKGGYFLKINNPTLFKKISSKQKSVSKIVWLLLSLGIAISVAAVLFFIFKK